MHSWLLADKNLQEDKEKESGNGLATPAQYLPNIGVGYRSRALFESPESEHAADIVKGLATGLHPLFSFLSIRTEGDTPEPPSRNKPSVPTLVRQFPQHTDTGFGSCKMPNRTAIVISTNLCKSLLIIEGNLGDLVVAGVFTTACTTSVQRDIHRYQVLS
jgi:hypothetical protein